MPFEVPSTLEGLLDMMRAKGVASFDFERVDVGKISLSLHEQRRIVVPASTAALGWQPAEPATNVVVDASLQPATRPPSDIDLALNPPKLDLDTADGDESADPAETIASLKAPRETAPAGATDSDADI